MKFSFFDLIKQLPLMIINGIKYLVFSLIGDPTKAINEFSEKAFSEVSNLANNATSEIKNIANSAFTAVEDLANKAIDKVTGGLF
jgi:hypothetical protein